MVGTKNCTRTPGFSGFFGLTMARLRGKMPSAPSANMRFSKKWRENKIFEKKFFFSKIFQNFSKFLIFSIFSYFLGFCGEILKQLKVSPRTSVLALIVTKIGPREYSTKVLTNLWGCFPMKNGSIERFSEN